MKNPIRPSLLVILSFCFATLTAGGRHALAQEKDSPPGRAELLPNDLIEIKVFQEDDLQSTLRISKDGNISFPLIGTVKVAYKTPQEAAATIRQALAKDQLVNPQVSVTVKEYAKRRFTVLGEVQKPGTYDMPDRDAVNLLEAIGMAGGYTRIAAPNRVTLKRVEDGKEVILRIDAKGMAKGRDNRPLAINPGDIITVGESIF